MQTNILSKILALENKILVFGAKKVGTVAAGGHRVFSQTFSGKKYFYVIPESGYYKYMDAQRAAMYGKKNADFFEFKTAAEAAKKINELCRQ